MKIFFDGGCRPNPGAMETAVFARGVLYHDSDLGPGASHLAEWHALLHALRVADASDCRDIVLIGDAANVIDQASGRARCTGEARGMLTRYQAAAAAFATVRLRQVRRGRNLAGIALQRLRSGAATSAVRDRPVTSSR